MAKSRVYIADLCLQLVTKLSHPSEILALRVCLYASGGGQAITNGFSHLLGSPKTLIKLNEKDSTVKMHYSSSSLHGKL